MEPNIYSPDICVQLCGEKRLVVWESNAAAVPVRGHRCTPAHHHVPSFLPFDGFIARILRRQKSVGLKTSSCR